MFNICINTNSEISSHTSMAIFLNLLRVCLSLDQSLKAPPVTTYLTTATYHLPPTFSWLSGGAFSALPPLSLPPSPLITTRHHPPCSIPSRSAAIRGLEASRPTNGLIQRSRKILPGSKCVHIQLYIQVHIQISVHIRISASAQVNPGRDQVEVEVNLLYPLLFPFILYPLLYPLLILYPYPFILLLVPYYWTTGTVQDWR